MIINNVEVSEEAFLQAAKDAGYTVNKTDDKKKPEASYTRWKPSLWEDYFYIDDLGRVTRSPWNEYTRDIYRLSIDNVAPCTDEGELYLLNNIAQKQAEIRVLDRVWELSEGGCGTFVANSNNYRPFLDNDGKTMADTYNLRAHEIHPRFYCQIPNVWKQVFVEMEDDVKLMMGVE